VKTSCKGALQSHDARNRYCSLVLLCYYLCAVLLLAYFNGNASLCRAIVKVGARLGVVNRDGLSIFNAPVATKQLLFKLLGAFAITLTELMFSITLSQSLGHHKLLNL